jgi:hypothetical protein
MENENLQKIFLSDKNTAFFECPKCHVSKEADVSKYKKLEVSIKLKIKCGCGNTYEVLLERRKYFRKDTMLPGKFTYRPLLGEDQAGILTILDISKGGLKFKMLTEPHFEKGEIIEVEFTLDNLNKTLIKKQVFVRNIKDNFVNVEYCSFDLNIPEDKAINLYV